MEIIPGILDEETISALSYDNTAELLNAFGPFINSDTAACMNAYIKNPNADKTVIERLTAIIGDKLHQYAYMADLYNSKVNVLVSAYNLFDVPTEFKAGRFCGLPIEEGIALIKKVLEDKAILKPSDPPPTSEDWSTFFSIAKSCFDSLSLKKLNVNRERIYKPRSSPKGTAMGVIISRLDMLEMGYNGVLYMSHVINEGLTLEGGSGF